MTPYPRLSCNGRGNQSNWVTKQTSTTKEQETTTKNTNSGTDPGQEHGTHTRSNGDGSSSRSSRNNSKGPTTEAGRKKTAETEATKREKEERKREKNRKKRWAYRERQREKHQYHYMPNRRATARSNWSHQKGESKSRQKERRSNDNKKKTKKEEKKGQNDEGRKKTKKKNVDQSKYQSIKNEEDWERMVFIALVGNEFDMLVKLFRYSLTKAATEQGEGNNDDATPPRRRVIKKYRSLSIKYHPDRHHKSHDQHDHCGQENAGDATDQDQTQKMKHIGICYKTAFQALNEAYSNVISQILQGNMQIFFI